MRRLIIFLLIFSACNDSYKFQDVSQDIVFDPGQLKPFNNSNISSGQILSQVYETLFELSKDYKSLIPKLAKSWEILEEQKTYRIFLRSDVHFSNGQDFTALDVKKSYLELKRKNPQNIISKIVKEVTIEDSLTILFHLNYQSGSFLYYLASPYGLLIYTEDNFDHKNEKITELLGTGPFIVNEFEKGIYYSISKNKKYWGAQSKIDHVRFSYYVNDPETYKTLADNRVDILYMVSGHAIDRLKWLGKVDYHVQNPLTVHFLGFNNQNELMKNRKLRAAIHAVIDKKKIVFNTTRGNAIIANGPLPPVYYSYTLHKSAEHNIRLAGDLLKETGVDSGITLNMAVLKIATARQILPEIIKAQLQKAGIQVNIIYTHTWEEHDKTMKSDQCHLFLDGMQSEVVGDAELFLQHLFHSKSKYNTLNYKNPVVDDLLSKLEKEGNSEERAKLSDEIIHQIERDVPAVFLYHVKTYFAYNKEKIKKMVVNPYGLIEYHKVELNTE